MLLLALLAMAETRAVRAAEKVQFSGSGGSLSNKVSSKAVLPILRTDNVIGGTSRGIDEYAPSPATTVVPTAKTDREKEQEDRTRNWAFQRTGSTNSGDKAGADKQKSGLKDPWSPGPKSSVEQFLAGDQTAAKNSSRTNGLSGDKDDDGKNDPFRRDSKQVAENLKSSAGFTNQARVVFSGSSTRPDANSMTAVSQSPIRDALRGDSSMRAEYLKLQERHEAEMQRLFNGNTSGAAAVPGGGASGSFTGNNGPGSSPAFSGNSGNLLPAGNSRGLGDRNPASGSMNGLLQSGTSDSLLPGGINGQTGPTPAQLQEARKIETRPAVLEIPKRKF